MKLIIVCILWLNTLSPAFAQLPDLCPGQQKVPSGPGGYMCVPYNSAPPSYDFQPPKVDEYKNPIVRELSRLGGALMQPGLQLYGNQPLSEGIKNRNESPTARVPAPDGYNDPYRTRERPAATPKPASASNTDPFTGEAYQLKPSQPDPTPQKRSYGQPGTYAACVGSSTFGNANPPSCEMSGYIYFRDGRILKNF